MPALIAILFATLTGSYHCVGMCGAFVTIASGSAADPLKRSISQQGAYHLGRLLTYLSMGAFAGALGSLLNLTAKLAGLQPVAAILAGATIILFGLLSLLKHLGYKLPPLKIPFIHTSWVSASVKSALDKPPLIRSLLIGLFTTLLPCGFLYMFVIIAAGAGSVLSSMLVMTIFWLGTLPMLALFGLGARSLLTPRLGKGFPIAASVLIVALGVFMIVQRSHLNPDKIAQNKMNAQAEKSECH